MAVAVPAALVFAAITGAVAALAKWSAGPPLLAAGVFGLCSFPFWLLVFWVAVVDRPTLEGAVDRPEDSIEQWWYREAASGALTDVFALTGLGAAVLTFTKDWRIEASTVLWIVACCIPISFAIRYLLGRRRG
ncbi:MAG: hypothetical protein LBS27_11975 [Bifidobacteriaceae bacterium]|jgi:hypothetical protein|nr:hypothetical protein [Bifidobacteriaceae bacterium]